MHLAISALNAWSLVFLTAALAGGLWGSSWHVPLGLLASLIAVMAQSAVFALFIGAAKTLKETVAVYRLPLTFISRTSEIYFRLFPWATAGALVTAAAAILGGLAHRSPAFAWIHGLLAAGAYVINIVAAVFEHRQLRRMHDLLAEMAAAVPNSAEPQARAAGEEGGGEPGAEAEGVRPGKARGLEARARGKAILTLSALGLVTLLGYHFLAGHGLSPLFLVLAGLALVGWMGLGFYFLARGAMDDPLPLLIHSPPMSATVAILGCLDTKGIEVRYLKEVLEGSGVQTHVLDAGVLGAPPFQPDTSREQLAALAGTTLEELRRRGDRGFAMEAMCRGATRAVLDLHRAGRIHALLAAGGSANTTIATSAMRALPTGFPKVMVSTLAAGDVSAYVGTRDLTLMYSVVDIAGLNRISETILANAARAAAAMALGREADSRRPRPAGKPLVAATMFGVTTPCVTEARRLLEEAGYEVLVFHATGTGGRAMEELIRDGYFAGVLDLTTTELADELVGGVFSAGPERLTAAGAAGIPQVVSLGALDMVNFGPPETVPEKFRGRKLYRHNPTVTLMRTTPEENAELGRRIAARLAGARAPVKVLLPLRGVSLYAKEGGPFHDPAADLAAIQAIRDRLPPGVERIEIDTDINDPAFARSAAEALLVLLRGGAGGGAGKGKT